jgi:hypothetical protein
MKFRKFGKTVLTAALSSAIVFSLSSCIRSFTVGYLYVTGTVTSTPSGNGIISGFKISNNNGALTPMHGLPIASGGANPVRIVLLSGGNFVYVLNQGVNAEGTADCTASDPCPNANITEFLVGGNGVLTQQNTYYTEGFNPMRLVQDSSGSFLLALDHDAPGTKNPALPSSATNPNSYCVSQLGTPTCSDVSVFSINSSTGRLSHVVNAQLTSSANTQVTYFPLPPSPIDFTFAGGYLLTLTGAPSASPTATATNPTFPAQAVYSYSYGAGQLSVNSGLTPLTNGAGNPVGQATAMVYAAGRLYVLDNEPIPPSTTPGQILPFTCCSAQGGIQSQVGGAIADDTTQTDPIYLLVDSKSKYLFLANLQGSGINNGAGITAYTIDPTSFQLTENASYPVPAGAGAAPQCILEDPSSQFIYTANSGDSTVSGSELDPNSGVLRPMQGWSGQIALNGPATWCVTTGRTN